MTDTITHDDPEKQALRDAYVKATCERDDAYQLLRRVTAHLPESVALVKAQDRLVAAREAYGRALQKEPKESTSDVQS